jgi:ferrous iron transport protein B
MVDLPGTYSLLSASPDEEVAREFILFGKPDVTVIVSDASCLERNLNLALQIVQITHRAVLCLNLMDEATSHSIRIDERVLAKDLGIPVIPCVARIGKGIPELVAAIHEIASGASVLKPYRLKLHVPGLPAALEKTKSMLDRVYPGLPHKQWIALRLLEGDPRITEAVSNGEIGMLRIDPHASLMSQSNAA